MLTVGEHNKKPPIRFPVLPYKKYQLRRMHIEKSLAGCCCRRNCACHNTAPCHFTGRDISDETRDHRTKRGSFIDSSIIYRSQYDVYTVVLCSATFEPVEASKHMER